MKKFLVNKENINLPIAEVLTLPDTLYELSGTHDLKGTTVTVPKGCVLKFEEGSKITNGILVLNNTQIEGAKHCIATTVSGVMEELDSDYFDLTMDNKTAIMQSIVDTANRIQLHGRLENVFNDITIDKSTTFIGNGATIVNTLSSTRAAMSIRTISFTKIVDLNYEINSGNAIYINTQPTDDAELSFMIDRCAFKIADNGSGSLIKLQSCREGIISNCFFTGYAYTIPPGETIYSSGIGIDRVDAVNTNVIGCMFNYLEYGIKATAEPVREGENQDLPSEVYSIFACGLNVQSAVIIGCKYGVFMEGNDSFFLSNSMVDFCEYPLVLISQNGANITNNYFSTATNQSDSPLTYNAAITVHNNVSSGVNNRSQRIIIENNTIYGQLLSKYGIEMDVDSLDCTIQGNTIDDWTEIGIHLKLSAGAWSTEKLVIDNNRLYYKADGGVIGIGDNNGDDTYSGNEQILLSNNCAYARVTSGYYLIKAGNTQGNPHGDYLYHNNRFRCGESAPASGPNEPQFFWGKQKSTTRFKFNLSFAASSTQMSIANPLGNSNAVVYIGNNKYPICVNGINSTTIYFTKSVTNETVNFIAVIELMNNI